MKRSVQVLLGVVTAIGGFIEIGDLVFLSQAGSEFRYQTLWAVVLGVIGIAVYAEMSGRVAATSDRAVFDVVRERLGAGFGLTVLLAAQVICFMTLAAELGGVAVILQLALDLPYRLLLLVAGVVFLAVIWAMPFHWIERLFGLLGLGLLVYVGAALDTSPDWSGVVDGLTVGWNTSHPVLYGYFAVGIIAAAFMPYEIYFYSSGGVEEGWKRPDLRLNRVTVLIGWGFGMLLAITILMTAAQTLGPRGIQPDLLGTVALGAEIPFGEAGLLLALLGMLFAVGGATAETALCGGYNLAQFFGWEWGKYRRPSGAPRFMLTAIVMLLLAVVLVATGVDPVLITELAVIFGVVALPFSYLPVLLVANDPTYMGNAANGRIANTLGWFYFGVLVIVAVAAIPLMAITNLGQN